MVRKLVLGALFLAIDNSADAFLFTSANAFQKCETLHGFRNFQCASRSSPDDDSDFFQRLVDESKNSVLQQKDMIHELSWRFHKVQLEEQETKRFHKRIKSKPWKLPYNDARKWVQANFGIDTKAEYYDLVANGNLRTPYIPKDPEKYYSEDGSWISWRHFLKDEPQQ